jgi:hypothetical protein
VFKEALATGLTIPETTIYAKHPGKTPSVKEGWYKKSLGFPCMVSHDKSTGTEKFVGNTNSICANAIEDGHYWQWQSPVKAKAQIRCQIIGERVWSVLWEKKNTPFVDLRENVNKKVKIEWQTYQLPPDTARKVIELMKRLEISIASPEFFIDQEDKLIFFDLNPCGDFRGFFPAEMSQEMVKSIYELCI